jgi:hypothetical protein
VALPADLLQRLAPGKQYHWVVEAAADGQLVRSRVAPFTLRAR